MNLVFFLYTIEFFKKFLHSFEILDMIWEGVLSQSKEKIQIKQEENKNIWFSFVAWKLRRWVEGPFCSVAACLLKAALRHPGRPGSSASPGLRWVWVHRHLLRLHLRLKPNVCQSLCCRKGLGIFLRLCFEKLTPVVLVLPLPQSSIARTVRKAERTPQTLPVFSLCRQGVGESRSFRTVVSVFSSSSTTSRLSQYRDTAIGKLWRFIPAKILNSYFLSFHWISKRLFSFLVKNKILFLR